MRKKYIIKLEGKIIGHTFFERADPPMGVVTGEIRFTDIKSGYEFFLSYCRKNNITININDKKYKFIDTQNIESMSVEDENGLIIKGLSVCVSGFDDEGFEIDVIGIPYPFYGEEFKHHREAYDNQFR